MSSQSVEKMELILLSFDDYREDSIDFNKIIIPFSKFGTSKNPEHVYQGHEKIVFKERHLIYQSIFLDEFSE